MAKLFYYYFHQRVMIEGANMEVSAFSWRGGQEEVWIITVFEKKMKARNYGNAWQSEDTKTTEINLEFASWQWAFVAIRTNLHFLHTKFRVTVSRVPTHPRIQCFENGFHVLRPNAVSRCDTSIPWPSFSFWSVLSLTLDLPFRST